MGSGEVLPSLAETLDGSPIGVAALKREGTESEGGGPFRLFKAGVLGQGL